MGEARRRKLANLPPKTQKQRALKHLAETAAAVAESQMTEEQRQEAKDRAMQKALAPFLARLALKFQYWFIKRQPEISKHSNGQQKSINHDEKRRTRRKMAHFSRRVNRRHV